MNTQRGTMAVLKLDDSSAQIEVTLFSDVYNNCRDLLVKDTIVIAEGRISMSDKTQRLEMRVNSLRSLEDARQSYATTLTIEVDAQGVDEQFSDQLASTLVAARGGTCPVTLVYRQSCSLAHVRLGPDWTVLPTDDLLLQLRGFDATERVFLQYQ